MAEEAYQDKLFPAPVKEQQFRRPSSSGDDSNAKFPWVIPNSEDEHEAEDDKDDGASNSAPPSARRKNGGSSSNGLSSAACCDVVYSRHDQLSGYCDPTNVSCLHVIFRLEG